MYGSRIRDSSTCSMQKRGTRKVISQRSVGMQVEPSGFFMRRKMILASPMNSNSGVVPVDPANLMVLGYLEDFQDRHQMVSLDPSNLISIIQEPIRPAPSPVRMADVCIGPSVSESENIEPATMEAMEGMDTNLEVRARARGGGYPESPDNFIEDDKMSEKFSAKFSDKCSEKFSDKCSDLCSEKCSDQCFMQVQVLEKHSHKCSKRQSNANDDFVLVEKLQYRVCGRKLGNKHPGIKPHIQIDPSLHPVRILEDGDRHLMSTDSLSPDIDITSRIRSHSPLLDDRMPEETLLLDRLPGGTDASKSVTDHEHGLSPSRTVERFSAVVNQYPDSSYHELEDRPSSKTEKLKHSSHDAMSGEPRHLKSYTRSVDRYKHNEYEEQSQERIYRSRDRRRKEEFARELEEHRPSVQCSRYEASVESNCDIPSNMDNNEFINGDEDELELEMDEAEMKQIEEEEQEQQQQQQQTRKYREKHPVMEVRSSRSRDSCITDKPCLDRKKRYTAGDRERDREVNRRNSLDKSRKHEEKNKHYKHKSTHTEGHKDKRNMSKDDKYRNMDSNGAEKSRNYLKSLDSDSKNKHSQSKERATKHHKSHERSAPKKDKHKQK